MRYIILVALNLPVIFIALVNLITQYKMHRVSRQRFVRQVLVWLLILIILVGSFPLYNHLDGRPIFYSGELTIFDIVQTTTLIFLFYVINHQRQQIERTEATLRELHQELSIKLSKE